MWQGPGTRTPSNRSQHPNEVAEVIWDRAGGCEVRGGRRGFGVDYKNPTLEASTYNTSLTLEARDGSCQGLWSFRKEEAHAVLGEYKLFEGEQKMDMKKKRWYK